MGSEAGRVVLAVLLVAIAGCRHARAPIDPGDTGDFPACPAGLHLVVGVQSASSDVSAVLLRYAGAGLEPCRGVDLDREYGTLSTLGGMPEGTDLVGFAGDYGASGSLVRFEGATETGRVDDPQYYPISIAPLTFGAQPAVAVLWGSGSGSSDQGERLDVYARSDLSRLGSWDVSYSLVRVGPAPSGQADRVAGLIGGAGLQEYRADAAATSLATTGELQVPTPAQVGYLRSLDVVGQVARAASRSGVLSWELGTSPAFLGPVQCRWPDTTGTPLPVDDADYVSAVIDSRSADDSVVLVAGELAGGSDEGTHLYVLGRRGECARIASYPSDYRAVAIAWAGR